MGYNTHEHIVVYAVCFTWPTGVQRQFGLDEDGKIYGVERHTAVARDPQGNTVGLVSHIGVTQDDEGNIHTAQVTCVVALPRQQTVRQQPALRTTARPPPTISTPAGDNVAVPDHDRCSLSSIIFFIGCILLTAVPFSMMIVGAMHIDTCPGDTKLGAFLVVQGLVSMSIPIAFAIWICCHCVEGRTMLKLIAPVAVFIFIWFIVGLVWVIQAECTDSTVYRLAWGYLVPVVLIVFGGVAMAMC
ncbi:uncharacterized protein [Haliotis cracherodii]|uniref:uncharacterized protein n=1 Tax=Haliotis cracherodii TaxID=6455 RepID=UPI0039EA1CB6